MKKKKIYIIVLCIIIFFIIGSIIEKKTNNNYLSTINVKIDNNYTTATTSDSKEKILINPGKGFVLRNNIDSIYNNKISVIYYRFNWSDIEPEDGKYNWNLIDDKLKYCRENNKRFAFGIMNKNSTSYSKYVTPKWIFDEGAKYYVDKNDNGEDQIIPNWTDEIFLKKLNEFVNALAKRYDGNQMIAYIDIRSYGNWGEQHLDSETNEKELSNKELEDLYIKTYTQNFTRTLLVNPWGKSEYNELYKRYIDNGVSIRRDGILKYNNGKEIFEYAYGKTPTIFEYYEDYKSLKKDNLWNEKELIKYINEWKPSYIEFFPEMYNELPDFCNYIANRVGYYFKFMGAIYKNNVNDIEKITLNLKFRNDGVAPLYEPCSVYIGLLDKDYKLVQKYKTSIDAHLWLSDSEKNENIQMNFEGINTGEYILAVGLYYNDNDKNPTYLLNNNGKTNDNWYVFGKIKIKNISDKINHIKLIDKALYDENKANTDIKLNELYNAIIENIDKMKDDSDNINQELLNDSLNKQFDLYRLLYLRNKLNIKYLYEKISTICDEYKQLYSVFYSYDNIDYNVECTDRIKKLQKIYNANKEDINLQNEEFLLNEINKIYNDQLTKENNSDNYLLKQKILNLCKIVDNMMCDDIKKFADEESQKVANVKNTDDITNTDVMVTINLPCKNSYIDEIDGNQILFTENGAKNIKVNIRGYEYDYTITVNNIDKKDPIINTQIEGTSISPTVEDENLDKITIVKDGQEIKYKSGDVLSDPGVYTITASDKAGNIATSKSFVYSIVKNEQNKMEEYIPVKTKVKAREITNNSEYVVMKDNKQKSEDDFVSTGDELKISNNTYILVSKGDVVGSGKADIMSLVQMRKNIVGLKDFTKIQQIAGDLNNDGEINIIDLVKERKLIIGAE